MKRRLNFIEDVPPACAEPVLKQIIQSYHSFIIKSYCHIRFRIIPLRFLQEIGQYLPRRGRVLDMGCGFGLFTLYFAKMNPETRFLGSDKSDARIRAAKRSAEKLGLTNVEFLCQDVTQFTPPQQKTFDAAITLDVLHHIPVQTGDQVLRTVHDAILADNSVFIIKDVTTRPRVMVYFTFLLDLLMNPQDSFFYRSTDTWLNLLDAIGFSKIETHYLWDVLPYPHVLFVARKNAGPPARRTDARRSSA